MPSIMMDCFIIIVGVEGDGPCWASLGLSEPLVRGCCGGIGVEGVGLAGPDWAFLSLW